MIRETGIVLDLNLKMNPKGHSLSGLRVAVKDLFDIKGVPTSAGNPDWLHSHPVPACTSSSIIKLLENGVTVMGKSLTDELAYSLNGSNIHYGTPINHRAPSRIPGGSSSGSAVAVACGIADIGLGTDTGGSIRVPASYNGLFGLRPTQGIIDMDNMVPLAPSFDTVGWLTKDIETLSKVADVLLPNDIATERMPPKNLMILKPEIAGKTIWHAEIDDWIERHKSAFDSIEQIALEDAFYKNASEAFRVLQGAQIWQTHGQWIEQEQPRFAVDIQSRFEWCKTLTDTDIVQAQQIQLEVIDQINSLLPDASYVLLLPTTPGAAPLLDSSSEFMEKYRIQLMGLTAIAGLCARPQLHLPVLTDRDAPWGVSLLGAKNMDLEIIQLAKTLLS